MQREPFQYAVIRVVPRIEREEFVNAGVILFCRTRNFLGAQVELDADRLRTLAPGPPLAVIREHLDALERVAAGDPGAGSIALLPPSERFHWLVAPSSTVIQASSVHTGLCADPAATLAHLVQTLVRCERTE